MQTSHSVIASTHDNHSRGAVLLDRLTQPVAACTPFQSNVPWKYVKIYGQNGSTRVSPQSLVTTGNTLVATDATVTNFVDNDKIVFHFPKTGFLDPKSVRVLFNLRGLFTSEASASSTEQFSYDANTTFSRCRVLYENEVLEDVMGYDLIANIMSCLFEEPQNFQCARSITNGKMSRGLNVIHDDATSTTSFGTRRLHYHNTGGLSASAVNYSLPRKYMVIPNVGFLHQNRLIPLHAMGQLSLEFTVNSASMTMFSEGITQTVQQEIGFPVILCKMFNPEPIIEQPLRSMIDEGRFTFQYSSWDYNSFVIPTPTQTNTNMQIRQRFKLRSNRRAAKYLLACIRCELDFNTAYNSYAMYSSWFVRNDGQFTPSQPALARGQLVRMSSLRSYCAYYNNLPIIPEVQCMSSANQYNATTLNSASSMGQSAALEEPVTPPVEPLFYLDDCFQDTLTSQRQIGMKGMQEFFMGYVDFFTCATGTNTAHDGMFYRHDNTKNHNVNRIGAPLIMAIPLSSALPSGTVGALQAGVDNETLELECCGNQMNDQTAQKTLLQTYGAQPLVLETFLCYDEIMTLTADGAMQQMS